jgi:hypothetical protein
LKVSTFNTFFLWVLFLLLSYSRLQFIFDNPTPISTDGFFYLVEFEHRITKGTGYYDKFAPLLSIIAVVGKTFSLSPEALFQLSVTSSLIILSLSLFLFLERQIHLSLIVPLSEFIFFRSYAFLEQSFALAITFLGLALIYQRGTRKEFFGWLLILFGALSHVSGAILVFTYGAYLLIRNKNYFFGALLPIVLIGFKVYNHETPLFSLDVLPIFISSCYEHKCTPLEWGEMSITIIFALIILLKAFYERNLWHFSVALAGAVLIFNLPIWSNDGFLGDRLILLSIWFILLAVAIHPLKKLRISYVIIMLLTTLLPKKEFRDRHIDPTILKKHGATLKMAIPESALISAPHGSQFRVTYYLKRRSIRNDSRRKRGITHRLSKLFAPGNCFRLPNHFVALPRNLSCIYLGDGWIITTAT